MARFQQALIFAKMAGAIILFAKLQVLIMFKNPENLESSHNLGRHLKSRATFAEIDSRTLLPPRSAENAAVVLVRFQRALIFAKMAGAIIFFAKLQVFIMFKNPKNVESPHNLGRHLKSRATFVEIGIGTPLH